ncbi:hypothetical protein F5Y01DRAFT_70075 [Xylaria sp. FL0043]|nr:hypothetical protein F5Y01DRAFT_70075 [Xylaria sp. FL0043]
MSRKSRARARARKAARQVEYDTGYTTTTITGHVTPPAATATPTINAVSHNSEGAAASGSSNGNGNGNTDSNNNCSRPNGNLTSSHHCNHNSESAAAIGNSDGNIRDNNKAPNPGHNRHYLHPLRSSYDSSGKYILPALAKYSDDKDGGDGDDDLAPRGSSILGGVPDIGTSNSRSRQYGPRKDVGAVGQAMTMGQQWVDIKKLEKWVWVPSKGDYVPRRELREKGEEHLASSEYFFVAPPEALR